MGSVVVVSVVSAVAGALRLLAARHRRRATEAPPWHFAAYHLPGRTA